MTSAKHHTSGNNQLLFIALIVAVVYLAFSNLFGAGFISWDDVEFTVENPDTRAFSIKTFFTHFYLGNYAPLTMMSFALDYLLAKQHAGWYHFTNITFHAINSGLVFLIFSKLQRERYIALFVALLFALHPMQTESVAWISERKNVLCGFFYLLGLLAYTRYITTTSVRNYSLVLAAFICALFSKGMAVSLPFTLLALDVWSGRGFTKKTLMEKIPFFALSFVFGIIAIKAQAYSGFLKVEQHYSWMEKFLFSGYAYLLYILKIFIPAKLSALYPYPKEFHVLQALGLLVFLAALALLFYSLKKKKSLLAGGLILFTGNILFVLQFVAQGAVLMADHYVYIAMLGVIYPALVFLFSLLKNNKAALLAFSGLALLAGIGSFVRNNTWKNSINFWTDIVKKYPASHIALNSLGAEYMQLGEYNKAHEYIGQAINLSPGFYKAYYNNGLAYMREGNYRAALVHLDAAIRINNYTKAIVARGNVFYEMKAYSQAMQDARTVLEKEPANVKALFLMANCYDDLNQLDKAMSYYNKSINLKNNEPAFYLRRAIVFGKMQRFNDCLTDLNTCTELNASFGEAYYWKGVAKVNLRQDPCQDLKKALELGFGEARNPLLKYCGQ